jgi:hypothetical protein
VTATRRLRLLALLAPAFAAGSFLRLWQLAGQVLGGDELHGVRAAVNLAPGEVLTHYALRDHSLPLTALFSWLLRQGVEIGELALRAPSVVAGLASLVVLPLALRHRLGGPATVLFAWLVAVSPLLVLYSRIARSYMPMTLAAAAAVAAFARWWEGGSRWWGGAYVTFAALALWLHLGAGPLLVAPLAFAAVDVLARGRPGRMERLRRLVGIAAALALAWAAFLLPARESLLRLVGAKRRPLTITPEALWDALRLQAGTTSDLGALAFWALGAAGLWLTWRHDRRWGLLTLTAVTGQMIGLAVLSPQASGHPLVLGRYLLVTLPFVLLWVATALAEPWRRPSSLVVVTWRASSVVVLLGLFASGPLPSMIAREGAFDHHNLYVGFTAPRPGAAAIDRLMPPAYRSLPPGPVLELPWPTTWDYARTLPLYQERHSRAVLVSSLAGVPRHPQLVLRNEVPPEPAAILASRARSLVVHLKLGVEEERFAAASGLPARRMSREDRQFLRRRATQLTAGLEAAWGPPDHWDEWNAVWDLDRVRQAR